MEFGRYVFGSIEIDGVTYEHDVVIEGGRIRKRKKGPSKALRGRYGHTPLTAAEESTVPMSAITLKPGSRMRQTMPTTNPAIATTSPRRI